MPKVHIEASEVIDAPPQAIYAILADYRIGHPAILPKPYFSDLTIEQGGQGAGTVMRFTVTIFGMKRAFHSVVSEPEPGRVLIETDLESDLVTHFIIDPLNGGTQTRLTITTDFTTASGFRGLMESWTSPPVMRRLYKQEMRQIADYVQQKGR